jgi:UTP--glucose-1-phosphate uridylyltransferase
VVLPDDLIDAERPALAELLDAFDDENTSVVAVVRPARRDAAMAAALVLDEADGAVRRVGDGWTSALPHVGLAGRCIFTPRAWPALARAAKGRSLADAIAALQGFERVVACEITGRHYDCATKLGWLQAQVAYARKRPDLWPQLRECLEDMLDERPRRARRATAARAGVRPALR